MNERVRKRDNKLRGKFQIGLDSDMASQMSDKKPSQIATSSAI